MVTGNSIPASAYDERFTKRRKRGLRELLDAGLRWVVVDLGAYNDQALSILDSQLGPYEINREYFKEGDGVLVIELDIQASAVVANSEPIQVQEASTEVATPKPENKQTP